MNCISAYALRANSTDRSATDQQPTDRARPPLARNKTTQIRNKQHPTHRHTDTDIQTAKRHPTHIIYRHIKQSTDQTNTNNTSPHESGYLSNRAGQTNNKGRATSPAEESADQTRDKILSVGLDTTDQFFK